MSSLSHQVRFATEVARDEGARDLPSNCFPSGFVYAAGVFTPEEQQRIIEIIDQHAFSSHIHRRQQFYGTVYYQTTTENAALQPESDVQPEEMIYCHSLEPLQWVVDRLIERGLFVEADPKEPLAEFVSSEELVWQRKQEERVQQELTEESLIAEKKSTSDATGETSPRSVRIVQVPCEENVDIKYSSEESRRSFHSHRYPTQILVNEYLAKQGIGNHYDDPRAFGPLILGISLGSAAKLTLTLPCCMDKARNLKRPPAYYTTNTYGGPSVEKESKARECDGSAPACRGADCPNKCSSTANNSGCSLSSSSAACPEVEDLVQDEKEDASEAQRRKDYATLTSLRAYVSTDWTQLPDDQAPAPLGRVCACLREEWTIRALEIASMGMSDKASRTMMKVSRLRGPQRELLQPEDSRLSTMSVSVSSARVRALDMEIKKGERLAVDHALTAYASEKSELAFVPAFVVASLVADEAYAGATAALGSEKRRNAQSARAKRSHGGGVNKLPPSDIHPTMKWLDKLAIKKGRRTEMLRKSLFTQGPPPSPNEISDSETKCRLDDDGTFVTWESPSLSAVNKCRHPSQQVDIMLEPGSVYVMAGDSRYRWRHGIKKVPSQREEGFRRISLTVRSLMPGRRRVADQ